MLGRIRMMAEVSYHALDNLECTRHLLQAGAKIAGTILYRALDLDDVDVLRLLLSFGADPTSRPQVRQRPIGARHCLWAIRRRRSPAQSQRCSMRGPTPPQGRRMAPSAHTLAQRFALPEVAGMLSAADSTEPVSAEERFLAACARADEATARRIKSERPDLPGALSEAQLRV